MPSSPQSMEAIFSDPKRFMARLKFQDTEGRLLYFNKPYPEQMALLDALEDPMVKIIVVLKARQVGYSTENSAHTWYKTYTSSKALRTLIVADHTKTTKSIFSKFETFYKWMPQKLKDANPFRINRNESLLVSKRTDAMIDHMTARGDAEARGWTYQRFVAEELASWPNAEEMWAGIQPTLHNGPDSKKIIISTPKGPGNFYHQKVIEAQEAMRQGDPSVRFIFSRWADHPTYRLSVPDWYEPTEQEYQLAQRHRLTPEQLYWRYQMIYGVEGIGEKRFRQEYPLTIEDGFMVTSGSWFDAVYLNDRLNELEDPLEGELRIYREPELDCEYVIGADPSWCLGGDFAVACVMNEYGEQCAVLAVKEGGEDLFSMHLADLSRKYYNARVLCEGNTGGAGRVVIKSLRYEGVPLWMPRDGKEYWITTRGNKEEAYARCRQHVNRGDLELNDHQTIQEMMHVREENGKIEGRDGHHDDHSMAFVLACWAMTYLDGWTGRDYTRERLVSEKRNPLDLITGKMR